MKLIDEAPIWYRMHSQRAMIVIASVQTMVMAMPQSVQMMKLPFVGHSMLEALTALTVVTAVLGFIGRLLPQENVSAAPKEDPKA